MQCKYRNCKVHFEPKHKNQLYHTPLCRILEQEAKMKAKATAKEDFKGESLCWSCKKATGGCSWSRSLTPIKGWNAESETRKGNEGKYIGYRVKECPLYEEGRR